MEEKKVEIELTSLSPDIPPGDNSDKKGAQLKSTNETTAAAPSGVEEENAPFEGVETNEAPVEYVQTIHLGNTTGFWFVNGMPLFTIGPDCKKLI